MAGDGVTEQLEERELPAGLAAGSESAMISFYRRYQGRVYGFALQRLGNPADAAEVLNEVMLEVWRGASRFQGRAKVTTWLLGITHHKCIDLLRKRGRREAESLEGEIDDSHPDPGPAAVIGAQDGRHVNICLDELPATQRHVVYLTFFEELSYPEIARILEIPEGTVKTRMFHARKLLYRCLERLGARG